ncbi:hypothetical protein MPSEU_000069300 [Mayamaea pseudoterrestris]|nr:hypothetical protein MPSEU_000069300 [Mayamaea pseudoterrestris]
MTIFDHRSPRPLTCLVLALNLSSCLAFHFSSARRTPSFLCLQQSSSHEAFGRRNLEKHEASGSNNGPNEETFGAMDEELSSASSSRRSVLISSTTLLTAAASIIAAPDAYAASTLDQSAPSRQSAATLIAPNPTITNKVQFNIRISRPDGSFYIRDDDANEAEIDRVFYCRLVVGLFGRDVPNHVQRFLSYCILTQQQQASDADQSLISYSNSMVTGIDPATGLLQAGVVPSLRVTLAVAGSTTAIEYRGRLLPASLWLDKVPNQSTTSTQQQQPRRLSHVGKGLLTHAKLDATPAFGITTRTDTRELDVSHQVFGRILFDESDGATEFLERARDLPTYSLERPASDDTPVEAAADAVFAAQRTFFRSLAKNVGDTRLDKVYAGKFLRRIEVTQVSIL